MKWLHRRIAALRGARSLAYLSDMSHHLALHPVRSIHQRFPGAQHV